MFKSEGVIQQFQKALKKEAISILNYWATYSPDPMDNGFYGQVDENNDPVVQMPKGSVLNARILWSFSTAYQSDPNPKFLELSTRAYHYFQNHFKDSKFGGAFWAINPPYQPTAPHSQLLSAYQKKQIYAQAFWIYALSSYYEITKDPKVLDEAILLFELIEKYSFDAQFGGYFEAFSRDWNALNDLRLSPKDENAVKTMNTHLHILEAYTGLYKIWPDTFLLNQIQGLLDCFDLHIIDAKTHHLRLFFDNSYTAQGTVVSYGHDIEAAWLLLEAASTIKDKVRIKKMEQQCVALAIAAKEGIDPGTGGLNYEKTYNIKSTSASSGHLIAEKHWWVQAEAMVGFSEAYLQTLNPEFLDCTLQIWQYIQNYILSKTGEWLWGINENGHPMKGYYKIGLWKCPYHNLRAMLEMQKRLNRMVPISAGMKTNPH